MHVCRYIYISRCHGFLLPKLFLLPGWMPKISPRHDQKKWAWFEIASLSIKIVPTSAILRVKSSYDVRMILRFFGLVGNGHRNSWFPYWKWLFSIVNQAFYHGNMEMFDHQMSQPIQWGQAPCQHAPWQIWEGQFWWILWPNGTLEKWLIGIFLWFNGTYTDLLGFIVIYWYFIVIYWDINWINPGLIGHVWDIHLWNEMWQWKIPGSRLKTHARIWD